MLVNLRVRNFKKVIDPIITRESDDAKCTARQLRSSIQKSLTAGNPETHQVKMLL